ncbi:uncharacterized protein LOC114354192 isoform X2 [Ostrinia furnacalis]|uniref:uncharacterized protein LOC114354192 isoform X2 n=1 Tax=Ostrinia furnacalis TaxID=93504 RepID=UPI00103900DC|nr:uncharacterized protein LOC114354192 isoform X2 [Ostrinia furnacalis]
MKAYYGVCSALLLLTLEYGSGAECDGGKFVSFVRWSGVTPERATPVFVYSASGDEESLTGACLARCRELPDCAAVLVSYSKGNCQGVTATESVELQQNNDVSYFKKICLEQADGCGERWWALESTPGYHLHPETPNIKLIVNSTVQECYKAVLDDHNGQRYRSAQWVGPGAVYNTELIKVSEGLMGNCILNVEDKFTEPESYRVSNYYTFYIENQCRHDYPSKIDRCSYEEYYNQTLKHVEFTVKNYTKDECKSACELEEHFICRGFTWTMDGRKDSARGLCDLHSEDLVTTGSWLLRRTSPATYYRRVICLNITVECEESNLVVTYYPRGSFRGRVYVPGRGERCGARAVGRRVRLALPLYGDCDVNFAYAITKTPAGMVNRTMAYAMVMIQNNPIIQTAGDRWVRVGCSPGPKSSTHSVDATVAVRDSGRPSQASESSNAGTPASASAVYNANTAPLTMYVVRAADDSATAPTVSLGEPLELRIETTDRNEIEAYHLVASSRLGDSSVLLLDSRGCSTGQVDFPPFTRTWMGGTQRLSARFKAFRFPTSHVVRFALMVRFCEHKCAAVNCATHQARSARETNDTSSYQLDDNAVAAAVREESWQNNRIAPSGSSGYPGGPSGVVAQGGAALCGAAEGQVPLEVEMVVGSGDVLSADTLVRADHHANIPPEEIDASSGALVCVHELLLVALALAWLGVQVLLLLGCCVLVKRYRNLAEMSMQKEYQSFDNVGFDVTTHRRVHWPDQSIDILHAT